MKFRTFALFAAAATAAAVWKLARERRRDAEITMELSGDGYQPDPAAESEGEAEESAPQQPLAAAADLTEAEEEWAEESRRPADPFAIADAADFSGDWEEIDCKG